MNNFAEIEAYVVESDNQEIWTVQDKNDFTVLKVLNTIIKVQDRTMQ